MRHYLAALHKKPDHHKKRFALLVSGGVTLLIFGIWSAVMFGNNGILAESDQELQRAHKEVGPLESLRANVSSSLEPLGESFQELRDSVLNTYGQ